MSGQNLMNHKSKLAILLCLCVIGFVAISFWPKRTPPPQWAQAALAQRMSKEAWESHLQQYTQQGQRLIAQDEETHRREFGRFLLIASARGMRDAGFTEGDFKSLPVELRESLPQIVATQGSSSGDWPADEHLLVVQLKRTSHGTLRIVLLKDGALFASVDAPVF